MSKLFQQQYNMTAEYYNKAVARGYYKYFDHLEFIPLFEYICDWMDSVSPICSMVEIGSGSAPILQKLKCTHQYTGIEIADKHIEMCNKKWFGLLYNKHATFIQADLETHFDSPFPVQGDILYDGNIFCYFNRDKIVEYLDKAMQSIQAKYFVTMNISTFFPFPKCSFLKLIRAKKWYVNIPMLSAFKCQRTIEIYERA